MRNIFILSLLFFYSINSFAQHPDLQGKRWYAKTITIDGVATNFSYDYLDFPYIFIKFWLGSTTGLLGTSNEIVRHDCQVGFTAHAEYEGTGTFNFSDFLPFNTDSNCNTMTITSMNEYVQFYNDTYLESYTYSISNESDGSKSLSIINNVGNELIYTDSFFEPTPDDLNITWFLHGLKIDDIDYSIPSNWETVELDLTFIDNRFASWFCDYYVGDIDFDVDNSIFYLYNTVGGLTGCAEGENEEYQWMYIDFLFADFPKNPFSYQITTDGEESILTVTNSEGDKAIYSNHSFVATEDISLNNLFSIYPNPIYNMLTIETAISNRINNIQVFNSLGQEVISSNELQLDLFNLKSGYYQIRIELNDGVSVNKKLLKM